MIDHLFAGNTLSLQLERRLNVETFKARETKVNTWSESSPLQWRDIRSRRVRSCCGLPSRTASMRRLTILPNTIRDDPKEMGARACKLLACTRAITLFFSPPSFFPFLFFFFFLQRGKCLFTPSSRQKNRRYEATTHPGHGWHLLPPTTLRRRKIDRGMLLRRQSWVKNTISRFFRTLRRIYPFFFFTVTRREIIATVLQFSTRRRFTRTLVYTRIISEFSFGL